MGKSSTCCVVVPFTGQLYELQAVSVVVLIVLSLIVKSRNIILSQPPTTV